MVQRCTQRGAGVRALLALTVALVGALCLGATALYAGAIIEGDNSRITDATLGDGLANRVRIAEHEGTLYAVWEDGRDPAFRTVYFARSTDGGVSWGPNIRVGQLMDDWINYPDIAVQPDGTIWIVWHLFWGDTLTRPNDIRLAISTDGGASFQVENLVNGVDGARDFWRNRIVADQSNGDVYVMSHYYNGDINDPGFALLLFRYDNDAGEWVEPETVLNDAPFTGRANNPTGNDPGPAFSLTARDGVICAAWEDYGRNIDERAPIYGACSTDRGETFGPNFKISGDDGIMPEIALGPDGELYAAYGYDPENQTRILLRRSPDQGATWGPERVVAQVTSDNLRDWQIEVDANGQVLLAYVRAVGAISSDVYLSTSVDQGQNFTYHILEDGQGEYADVAEQFNPALATGGTGENTRAYIAWSDDRNLGRELWSARAVLDGIAPTVPANLATTAQERAVRIRWDAAQDATGIAGYRVYRATSEDGPFTELTTRLNQATYYVDVELDGGPYYYRVAAVDNTGNTGEQSAVVSGAPASLGEFPYSGMLAYETGNNLRVRNLESGEERTITEADQPLFSTDGESLYFRSRDSVNYQPIDGGQTELFFTYDGLVEFDLSAAETHYAILATRQFGSTVIGGACFVSEPHYGRPGQQLYTDQFDYGSEIALSADRKWMLHRTEGFCNIAAAGVYTPPRLCVTNLEASETACLTDGIHYRTPDFAPEGNWFVFAAPFTGQDEIWKAQIQADGSFSNFVQLTSGPAGQPARWPSWSGDGNWIVFQRDVDTSSGEDWRLFTVRVDGVGVRALDLTGERPALLSEGGAVPPPPLDHSIYLPGIIAE